MKQSPCQKECFCSWLQRMKNTEFTEAGNKSRVRVRVQFWQSLPTWQE